jgi:NADH dehydrogenase FAD-containing subunit
VVATGADARPEEIPGLGKFGLTVWTLDQMLELRAALHRLVDEARDGRVRTVLFLMPPGNGCSGPLYEMAMLLDTWLRRKRVREQVRFIWSTSEAAYLEIFGPRLHELVAEEFRLRGITGYTGYVVDRVEEKEVVYRNGERLPFDLLISFPSHTAPALFRSLPTGERGLISTDLRTGQITGYPDVYAVGDACDFPIKQAHVASLQAGAAAGHIAARVLGTSRSLAPDPMSSYVVPAFDNATFVRVPFDLAGRAAAATAIAGKNAGPNATVALPAPADCLNVYQVGSSPVWKLGKLASGVYLPWRFKEGNPFQPGAPWKGIESALMRMSGVPAR